MESSALRPVFVALRIGLYLLIAGLGLVVVVRALVGDSLVPAVAICLVVLFEATFFLGVWRASGGAAAARPLAGSAGTTLWLAVLTCQWILLVFLAPDAAFLVFPLFFCYLHLLPSWQGPAAVVVAAVAAVVALGAHRGFTLGGVIGPLIGAAVAIAIGLAYAAMYREMLERNRLLTDLMEAQEQLAVTERNAGIAAERTRLAAEIHDTVAQGLSSIQMLLGAAQRADPAHAGAANIELARQTAAENLSETRRFIRELSSPQLDARTLVDALQRVVAHADARSTTAIRFAVDGTPRPLPRPVETTALRIVQGSLANVVAHAQAAHAVVTLSFLPGQVSLDIVDDGVGFDVRRNAPPNGQARASAGASAKVAGPDSFGLTVMRERVARLGGDCVVESTPGSGTAVTVSFATDESSGAGPGHPSHESEAIHD